MRSGGRTSHFRFRQTLRKKLDCRHAEQGGQSLNCARAHILRAPLNALIPLDVSAKQRRDLLLRQAVPFAQLADAGGDEFE